MHFKDIEVSTHASANEMRNCNIPAIRKFLMNALLNHCGKSERVQVVLITIPLASLAPSREVDAGSSTRIESYFAWLVQPNVGAASEPVLARARRQQQCVGELFYNRNGAEPDLARNLSHNTK
jgi:hypothetical protein